MRDGRSDTEEEDAELVWDVRKDGTLVASIENPDVMVARSTERTDRLSSVSSKGLVQIPSCLR